MDIWSRASIGDEQLWVRVISRGSADGYPQNRVKTSPNALVMSVALADANENEWSAINGGSRGDAGSYVSPYL